MAENFKKKICLITGARTGIGLSIGQTLAKNGYRVIFSGRSVNDCKDTVNELMANGLEAVEAPIDLSNLSSLKEQVEMALSIWGTVDILINNAGVGITGPLEETPNSEIEKHFKTNLYGPINLIKKVLPHMRKNNNGLIINITLSLIHI